MSRRSMPPPDAVGRESLWIGGCLPAAGAGAKARGGCSRNSVPDSGVRLAGDPEAAPSNAIAEGGAC